MSAYNVNISKFPNDVVEVELSWREILSNVLYATQ